MAPARPTISTHVLDLASGDPAPGVGVALFRLAEDGSPELLSELLAFRFHIGLGNGGRSLFTGEAIAERDKTLADHVSRPFFVGASGVNSHAAVFVDHRHLTPLHVVVAVAIRDFAQRLLGGIALLQKPQAERTKAGQVIGPLLLSPTDGAALRIAGWHGTALYPAFQFTEDGRCRQDIKDVVREIRDECPATDDHIAEWLRTPHDSLDGMTPEAGLAAGDPSYGRVFALAFDFAWAARESLFM